MKKYNKIIMAVLVLAGICMSTSCLKDDDETVVLPVPQRLDIWMKQSMKDISCESSYDGRIYKSSYRVCSMEVTNDSMGYEKSWLSANSNSKQTRDGGVYEYYKEPTADGDTLMVEHVSWKVATKGRYHVRVSVPLVVNKDADDDENLSEQRNCHFKLIVNKWPMDLFETKNEELSYGGDKYDYVFTIE